MQHPHHGSISGTTDIVIFLGKFKISFIDIGNDEVGNKRQNFKNDKIEKQKEIYSGIQTFFLQ